MKAIVCADQNWGIGNQGHLLVNIPSDMKFFRDTTIGNVVVMGRRTFDDLPGGRPLEGRVNIVLSRDPNFHPKDVIVVRGKKELFEELKKYETDEIFIIGGPSVYELMLPYCAEVFATKVDFVYQADCYFPNLDYMPEWELAEESEEQTCFDIEFVFRKYRRKYHTAFPEM